MLVFALYFQWVENEVSNNNIGERFPSSTVIHTRRFDAKGLSSYDSSKGDDQPITMSVKLHYDWPF